MDAEPLAARKKSMSSVEKLSKNTQTGLGSGFYLSSETGETKKPYITQSSFPSASLTSLPSAHELQGKPIY